MTIGQLTNAPATLKLAGVDSGGKALAVEIPIARSLPAAVTAALVKDLVAIGRERRSPYHLLRSQLSALSRLVTESNDPAERSMLTADRQAILNRLTDCIVSGRADELAEGVYLEEAGRTPEGLRREIAERAKHAGSPVDPAELAACVTVANAHAVRLALDEALETAADPTAGT